MARDVIRGIFRFVITPFCYKCVSQFWSNICELPTCKERNFGIWLIDPWLITRISLFHDSWLMNSFIDSCLMMQDDFIQLTYGSWFKDTQLTIMTNELIHWLMTDDDSFSWLMTHDSWTPNSQSWPMNWFIDSLTHDSRLMMIHSVNSLLMIHDHWLIAYNPDPWIDPLAHVPWLMIRWFIQLTYDSWFMDS